MKIRLNKPIIGYRKVSENQTDIRVHAEEGDVLPVILHNPTHFICDSVKYPNQVIAVFNSQCEIVERAKELVLEDPHEVEKYYHVYEEPTDPNLYDPFYTAFEFET
jgi:hypothetical protein